MNMEEGASELVDELGDMSEEDAAMMEELDEMMDEAVEGKIEDAEEYLMANLKGLFITNKPGVTDPYEIYKKPAVEEFKSVKLTQGAKAARVAWAQAAWNYWALTHKDTYKDASKALEAIPIPEPVAIN